MGVITGIATAAARITPVPFDNLRRRRRGQRDQGDVVSNLRTTGRRCDPRRASSPMMRSSSSNPKATEATATKRAAKTSTLKALGLPHGSNPKLASPLRYPGAKRRLLPVITSLVGANFADDAKPVFIEPFAGGASVALGLLAAERVNSIVLGELDPMLAAFWRVATEDSTWLINKVASADVTIEQWKRLHANPGKTDRELAWACLFLNRTSYSGILHPQAGPIGGPRQASEYTIDCRFPKPSLKVRLERIAAWAKEGRITVIEGDYRDVLDQAAAAAKPKTPKVAYLDPPFYAKAEKLYRKSFTDSDHQELAKELRALALPWILSYDHAEFVVDLYGDHGGRRLVEMTYVASTGRAATRELIVTNFDNIPDDDRLEVLT